jgi:hypothetical protein
MLCATTLSEQSQPVDDVKKCVSVAEQFGSDMRVCCRQIVQTLRECSTVMAALHFSRPEHRALDLSARVWELSDTMTRGAFALLRLSRPTF